MVGSGPDAESTLLADVYAAALRSYGIAAHVETAPDPLAELDSGAFTVVPGFTGRLLQGLQPGATATSRQPGLPRDDRGAARRRRRGRLHHCRRGQARAGGDRATAEAWGGSGC